MLEKKVSNTLRSKPVCTSKKKKKNLRTGLEPASTPQEKKVPVALPPEPGGT